MPYAFTWGGDPEDVCATVSGPLGVDNFLEFVRALVNDPHFRRDMRILADYRSVEMENLSEAEIQRLADELVVERARFGKQARVANVVAKPHTYGLGRMLLAYMEWHLTFEDRIFYEIEEAREWLRAAADPK